MLRFLVSVFIVGFASAALVGQVARDTLVGTWQLVSASASTPGGTTDTRPFGARPSGRLIYTAEGTMSAVIAYSDRNALSKDRVAAPVHERAEAFATSFAYAGRYSAKGETVIHHVEVSTVPNWVGTDLIRVVSFESNRLTLRTPPIAVAGESRTTELVWERVRK